jgi:hypothetical protein
LSSRCRHFAILAIQLVGHIAAYSADPVVIKAADIELLPTANVTIFVGSSIQKPKFSSALDEVVPFGASTMTTFLLGS